MYIRMLYYYAMLTSHCNILKMERGEGWPEGGRGRDTHLAQHPERILL